MVLHLLVSSSCELKTLKSKDLSLSLNHQYMFASHCNSFIMKMWVEHILRFSYRLFGTCSRNFGHLDRTPSSCPRRTCALAHTLRRDEADASQTPVPWSSGISIDLPRALAPTFARWCILCDTTRVGAYIVTRQDSTHIVYNFIILCFPVSYNENRIHVAFKRKSTN